MSILETRRTRHLVWPDETACAASARALAMQPGIAQAFIELRGELGAGKTTFVRHLLRALGVEGRIKSPSYAVVEAYSLPAFEAWHFDFYRFDDPREWEDAGFRELFASKGLKLVEWPEKAAGLLPLADLRIDIEAGTRGETDTLRRVSFSAGTALGLGLLAAALAPDGAR